MISKMTNDINEYELSLSTNIERSTGSLQKHELSWSALIKMLPIHIQFTS